MPVKKIKPKKQPNNFADVVSEEWSYIRRGEKRLSTDFLGGITVMLITILVIVALALMNAAQKLDNEIYNKTANLRESIAENLINTITNRFEEENSVIDATLATMIKSKLIAYCVITDPADTDLLYSTIHDPQIVNGAISTSALERNNIKNTVEITKKQIYSICISGLIKI